LDRFSKKWVYITLCAIVLLGLQLRLQSIRYTVVDTPIRADAREYLIYALNLKQFHIYSNSTDALEGKASKPTPDAIRTPGYPLFLTIFIGNAVTNNTLYLITIVQALLSAITICLAYFTFATLLNRPLALIVALLTAISPHLVFTNVYILSETLSCFLLMLFLWFLSRWRSNSTVWLILVTGMLLALTTLTRPWTQYFPILLVPLMAASSPLPQPKHSAVWFSLGFILFMMTWIMRNYFTLGVFSNDSVMIHSLYQGHFPGLMYDNRPETLAYPHRFDPRQMEVTSSLSNVLREIVRRFRDHPLDYLSWYLFGKPALLFSWDIFEGQGDLLIYPVFRTPYADFALFKATHWIMHTLHYWVVLLAAMASVFAWLPNSIINNQCFMLRCLSLLFGYFVLIHCILKPEARYLIPMLPVVYGLAMFGLCYLWGLLKLLTTPTKSRLMS